MLNMTRYKDIDNRLGTKLLKFEESIAELGYGLVITSSFIKCDADNKDPDDMLAGSFKNGYPSSLLAKGYVFNSKGKIQIKLPRSVEATLSAIFDNSDKLTLEKDGQIIFRG